MLLARRIALLLVIAIAFGACKKYEEGPGFTLRGKKGRLKGGYLVISHTEDGVSTLDPVSYEYSYNCISGGTLDFTDSYVETRYYAFSKDGEWEIFHYQEVTTHSVDLAACTAPEYTNWDWVRDAWGTWEFIDDEASIRLTYDDEDFVNPAEDWEIVKLKNKSIKFKRTDGSKLHEVELGPYDKDLESYIVDISKILTY